MFEGRSKNRAAGKTDIPVTGGWRNRILIGNAEKLYALIGTNSFLPSSFVLRKLNFLTLMELFDFAITRPEVSPSANPRPGL